MNAIETRAQTGISMAMVMRVVVAAAILVGGWVHFSLWQEYGAIPSVGPMFLMDAIFSVFVAAALLVADDLFVLVVSIGFQVGALGALAMSYYSSLFGFHNPVISTDSVVAIASESLALVILLALVATRLRTGRSNSV
jgi:hypothetical protein